MTLAERLGEAIRACFTGLWIQSHEHEDALAEIARVCREQDWSVAVWDIDGGLQLPGATPPTDEPTANDPLAAVRALRSLAQPEGTAVLVLVNFHRFLNSAEIVQALCRQITGGKQHRTFVVVLSPVVQIPVELEKQFLVLEHELPNRQQIEELARSIATEEGELPAEDLETVLEAAAGLTRMECEGAFSLSLVREGQLTAQTIWELKSQMLKKSGLLELYRGAETFADLGGLGALKAFCRQALRRNHNRPVDVRPRGVLLLGVSGTGKSAFAKALGNETGRPTLLLDIGTLMASLVGQTESNVRQALKIADAMAPCVLFIDEVEKALSGAASSGRTDSGVSARLFGSFLTWLNDHASDVFVVATCNDISQLPPEFSRAERWDGVWFLDLPSTKQQQQIWQLYRQRFGVDAKQPLPPGEGWTGAEIRSCCRLSALLDVPLLEAARHIVPVAFTAHESVERLRTWASGRCLSADRPGLYQRNSTDPQGPRRRVKRDPSAN